MFRGIKASGNGPRTHKEAKGKDQAETEQGKNAKENDSLIPAKDERSSKPISKQHSLQCKHKRDQKRTGTHPGHEQKQQQKFPAENHSRKHSGKRI